MSLRRRQSVPDALALQQVVPQVQLVQLVVLGCCLALCSMLCV